VVTAGAEEVGREGENRRGWNSMTMKLIGVDRMKLETIK
jgi:hypothetical protein